LRRSLALVTLFLLAAAARPAAAANLDLRIGGFFPRASGTLFEDDASLYFVDPKKDFDGLYGGLEFNMKVAENLELGFSVDGYGDGLIVVAASDSAPGRGMAIVTTYGLDPAAFDRVKERWTAWWQATYPDAAAADSG